MIDDAITQGMSQRALGALDRMAKVLGLYIEKHQVERLDGGAALDELVRIAELEVAKSA